jgi:hypothetical protein
LQVFDNNQAVFGRELVGSLVAKVHTAISDTLEHTANCANSTPSAVRAVLPAGQTPVQPSQMPLLNWDKADETEALAVAGRHRQDHTTVDAYRRQAVRSKLGHAILDTEGDVPMEAASLDGDVADDSAERPAPAEANHSQFGQSHLAHMSAEPSHFPDLGRIREAERQLPLPLLPAPMHTPNPVLTACLVEIAQCLLQTLRRGFGEPALRVLRFGQFAALAGETRPDGAIFSPPVVELGRGSALVECRVPHAAAHSANPLCIAELIGVQLKSIPTPKKHQTFFWSSTHRLIAACAAPPVLAMKYAFVRV